jgi:hypothetical protein
MRYYSNYSNMEQNGRTPYGEVRKMGREEKTLTGFQTLLGLREKGGQGDKKNQQLANQQLTNH